MHTARDVERVLGKARAELDDLPVLLSEAGAKALERLAQRAHELTKRHFGDVVQLFTPLYISNYCDNRCRYCSFARQYDVERRHLEPAQIRAECERIAATGMRHVLLLTGESRRKAPPEYLADAVRVCAEFFSAIAIEVYPLEQQEYAALVQAGVDSLTLYQEVYDRKVYAGLHEGGPKSDYDYRYATPERACEAGMHAVTVGPLLGLAEPVSEVVAAARHLDALRRKYPGVEFSIALPRMRPLVADFPIAFPVTDRQYVQFLTALRVVFPTVGLTVSTRESRAFRNAILPMGVTKMSAGVSTAVGGRADGDSSTAQFEIADTRTLEEMRRDLMKMGYQPVMQDWSHRYLIAD